MVSKYPGYRTMTAAQRYNARLQRIFEEAWRVGASGPQPRKHILKHDVTVTPWASAQGPMADTFTVPAGAAVRLIKGADGLKGDLWAVSDIALLKRLSGNAHDPVYRYVFVDAADVEAIDG